MGYCEREELEEGESGWIGKIMKKMKVMTTTCEVAVDDFPATLFPSV